MLSRQTRSQQRYMQNPGNRVKGVSCLSRIVPLVFMLILACALVGVSASILPVAGIYTLAERTEMQAIRFSEKSSYFTINELSRTKPEALKLDVPMLDEVYYYEFRLGELEKTQYMVIGRSDAKWANVLYFDANADKIITKNERVKVAYTYFTSSDGKLDMYYSEPIEPLRVKRTYLRADKSAFEKALTISVEIVVGYQEQAKTPTPLYFAIVAPSTWFYGEVAAGGNRVLKVAVIDGNKNGLFNEAKSDYLLIDENYDNVFDWDKEREPLGDDLSGLGPDGKKIKLVPALAEWPQKLCLALKGTTPDFAQLEGK